MNTDHPFARFLARYRFAALGVYGVVVVAFFLTTWISLANIYDSYTALTAATNLLDQIEGRKPTSEGAGLAAGVAPTGSPFLEGSTVTVAGAALQQRVAAAVGRVGGNVVSSQVDLEGPQAKAGFVSLTTSCEIDQPALQQLLYDLEAGMPFLFVDQLEVQAPQGVAVTEGGGRLRVLVKVSGQWEGSK
jgi:general secretion pathway protein M